MVIITKIKRELSFMFAYFVKIFNLYSCCVGFLSPLVNLIIRIYIGRIFWLSGLTKLKSWENTLWLFSYEYHVPIIPSHLAAIISTSAEITCPILLLLGIGTRISSMALLIMTLVIQFTYDSSAEHYYWMILLGTLITYGGDKLSLDYIIKRKYIKSTL